MRLLLISSEAVPYSKTGGLADVSTALAKALATAGHEVSLVLPYHVQAQAKNKRPPLSLDGPQFSVRLGDRIVQAESGWDTLPAPAGPDGSPREVRVLFVHQPDYFDRPGLYGDPAGDYEDNAERFIFFSRAALELARLLVLRPHCVHANDWQTGLVPAMLQDDYRGAPGFESTGSVFTIHNLAFQGSFPHWDMRRTGLDWTRFHYTQFEHHGRLNLLKAGVAAADKVTTVSPTYAQEIRSEALGYGLEGALIARGRDLSGVLNGVDPAEWSPREDPHLAANYAAANVAAGKAACKAALRTELKLLKPAAGKPDPPLFGMISRMTDQKGFDLIAGCSEELIATGAQFAFLGTGDPRYEGFVRHLANQYPGQVAGVVGFDNGLAHRIEAGCDAYLMPSLYEPCGLNQLYSLAYGTVPVVHAVGGLADTVVDATPARLADGTANGFVFDRPTPPDLWEAVSRAVECYRDAPADWAKLVQHGMAADHSWDASAAEYVQLYRAAAARHARD